MEKLVESKKVGIPKNLEFQLSFEEITLLKMIRLNLYETINIKLKGGKIERLEATEFVKDSKRISELLREGQYQLIEIYQENGKVISIKRTTKSKF